MQWLKSSIVFNPFATGNNTLCCWRYRHAKYISIGETFLPNRLIILKRLIQNWKFWRFLLLIFSRSWTINYLNIVQQFHLQMVKMKTTWWLTKENDHFIFLNQLMWCRFQWFWADLYLIWKKDFYQKADILSTEISEN